MGTYWDLIEVAAIPEQLELVDELPRNAMGKVMVAALRARYGPATSE